MEFNGLLIYETALDFFFKYLSDSFEIQHEISTCMYIRSPDEKIFSAGP